MPHQQTIYCGHWYFVKLAKPFPSQCSEGRSIGRDEVRTGCCPLEERIKLIVWVLTRGTRNAPNVPSETISKALSPAPRPANKNETLITYDRFSPASEGPCHYFPLSLRRSYLSHGDATERAHNTARVIERRSGVTRGNVPHFVNSQRSRLATHPRRASLRRRYRFYSKFRLSLEPTFREIHSHGRVHLSPGDSFELSN